jgi:ribosome-associated toxin RatA of RatAB toxin-antitoxin module
MRWSALVCLLTLLTGAGAAGAIEVRVQAHRDGDAVLVEASADLSADRQIAWEVLTGYDHYAEFVPDLRESRILERSGATAIVEQSGEAGMFLFRFPMEVRLAITEEPFETVRCHAIAGNFRELTGVYRLEPGTKGLRFLYSGRLVPHFRLPPLVGLPAVRASVERQFRGLVQEIERRAAAAGAIEQGSK